MFKWVFRVIGLIIILGVLLVFGTCAWQNCRSPNDTKVSLEPPSIESACYSVNITVTHSIYYSDKVDIVKLDNGDLVTMHGYWETTKGKYKFRDVILSLNEAVFGPIEVKKR